MNETLLKSALAYAARGWPVIPLKGKLPVTSHGVKDATTDPETVARLFTGRAEVGGVGIAAGPASALVIDFDGEEGNATLEKWEAEHGPLPKTPAVATPNGAHFYFRHPAFQVKNAVRIQPGVDIRSAGGYVCAPPSIHPSGGIYAWVVTPAEAPLAECPPWLLELLPRKTAPTPAAKRERPAARDGGLSTPYGLSALEAEAAAVSGTPEGGRNDALNRSAFVVGSLVSGGELEEAEAVSALVGAAEKAGLSGKEIEATIRSGMESGKREPRKQRKARPPSVADRLIKIGKRAELFHDETMDGYGSISVNGHLETYPIRAKGFRQWLEHQYYMETRKQPGAQGIQDALSGLEAAARFDGKRREVSFRVAGSDGGVFIDLCNESWEAVKVTRAGWEIQKQPEIRFIRRRGQMALPTPERGGSLELLRPFLNTDDDGFLLCLMWLVSATNPGGPFPILAVSGEQGSGKSTVSKVLKSILDPSTAALRSMPREERDFAVFAKNAFVLGLDNLSGITSSMSDTICRVVYGHGFATRELFTNDDEAVFCGARPVIINGIEDLLHRPDLADRAVTVHCETIQESRRKEEKVFWSDFAAKHPAILGALLDAVVVGLARMPDLTVDRLPRMADAAKWVIACEPALPWKEGRFLEVYRENIKVVRRSALEADDFAVILLQALEEKGRCEMTALDVLTEVNHRAAEATRKSRGWPENPKAASNRLKRLAPLLRSNGWTFSPVGHDPKSRRTLNLFTRTQEKEWGKYPSHPSHPSGHSEPIENATDKVGEGCEGYAKDTEGYAKGAKDTPFYPSGYPSGVTDCKQREAKDAKDTKDEITIHSLVLDSDGGNGKGSPAPKPPTLTDEQWALWQAGKPKRVTP